MSAKNRLPDYMDHLQQAAIDACSFVEGLSKDDFLADKRTQQAVIMVRIQPPGIDKIVKPVKSG